MSNLNDISTLMGENQKLVAKKKLLVDMGSYLTTFSIVDYGGQLINFHTVNRNSDDIVNGDTSLMLPTIISTVKNIKQDYPEIGETIIVIPSQDILLKSKSPITPDEILTLVQEKFNINAQDELVVAIGEPYQYNQTFFVPISIYDEQIDVLIEELNYIGAVKENQRVNRDRVNLILQTSINKLQKAGEHNPSRHAVIDAGYKTARVGIFQDGTMVDYREFDEMSGMKALQEVANNSTLESKTIVGWISKSKLLQTNTDAVVPFRDYIVKSASELREYLIDQRVTEVIQYGGISNVEYLGNRYPIRHTTIEVSSREFTHLFAQSGKVTTDNIVDGIGMSYSGVDQSVLYKLAMNSYITAKGTILDEENLMKLIGKTNIEDERSRIQLKVNKIDEEQREKVMKNKESYLSQTKPQEGPNIITLGQKPIENLGTTTSATKTEVPMIDVSEYKAPVIKTIQPVEVERQEYFDTKIKEIKTEEIGFIMYPAYKELEDIPLSKEDEMTERFEEVAKLQLNSKRSYFPRLPEYIVNDIENKKRNYRELSTEESNIPLIRTTILSVIVAMTIFVTFHIAGFIEVPMFETIGLATETTKEEIRVIDKAIREVATTEIQRSGLPAKSLKIESRNNTRTKEVNISFRIPKDLKDIDTLLVNIENNLKNLQTSTNNWKVTREPADKGFYVININGEINPN